jgi:hypothetical protein
MLFCFAEALEPLGVHGVFTSRAGRSMSASGFPFPRVAPVKAHRSAVLAKFVQKVTGLS